MDQFNVGKLSVFKAKIKWTIRVKFSLNINSVFIMGTDIIREQWKGRRLSFHPHGEGIWFYF
jgi:hypothetical protein